MKREKVGDSFRALQRGLTGERQLIGASYMDDPGMLRGYLDYYWPVSRAQARFALSALIRRGVACTFGACLDVGSGPGPIAAACAGVGARQLVLLDQSRAALDLATREIVSRTPREADGGCNIQTVVMDIAKPETQRIPLWGQFNLVTFGHSLNELWASAEDRLTRRSTLLARYAQALTPGGLLLIIEPALLNTSRDLLAVRNLLVADGWKVLAPCPGRETLPCPALEAGPSHTCHEEISWQPPPETAALAASLDLDKESLKMTWFILEPPRPDGFRESEKSSLNVTSEDELSRVVSDPMLNKAGRIRRLLCNSRGRFPLSAAVEGKLALSSGFAGLKRGDYIRVRNPEIRENGWGVGPETRIEVPT